MAEAVGAVGAAALSSSISAISGPLGIVSSVIGLTASIIGLTTFAMGRFPPAAKSPDRTTLRIVAGLNIRGLEEAEGAIQTVKLYNEGGELISDKGWVDIKKKKGMVNTGAPTDFSIKCKGQQATYVQLFGSQDAICIAYIAMTWPDDTKRAWSGDMGSICGRPWSYSNVFVGDDGQPHMCTWLEQDDATLKTAAIQVHMQDFTNNTVGFVMKSKEYYCNAPAMIWKDINAEKEQGFWGELADYRIQKRGDNNATLVDLSASTTTRSPLALSQQHHNEHVRHQIRARGLKKRSPAMQKHLIGSHHASQSARHLCESDSSHSPDFVSFHEGIYCHAGEKRTWPLCSMLKKGEKKECFDWKTKSLITADGTKSRDHFYDNVEIWNGTAV